MSVHVVLQSTRWLTNRCENLLLRHIVRSLVIKFHRKNFTLLISQTDPQWILPQGLRRKAHFLGTKIKSLRKRNNLTLEDLSVRCVQVDAAAGPSVSYLSMIENGKRVPSERLLQIVAGIFQKDVSWFYDESLDDRAIDPTPSNSAVTGLALEPGFLFSENLLQLAIPELLAQTGTTGRQFAHLLIRAHQESSHNRFPGPRARGGAHRRQALPARRRATSRQSRPTSG